MDHLWTPWRYAYVTGTASVNPRPARKGVPPELSKWPGPDTGPEADPNCVFCNLIRSVRWGIAEGMAADDAERAGLIVTQLKSLYICLNAFPYSSGHLLLVPYRHLDSLAALPAHEAAELIHVTQTAERVLRTVYQPDGINLGMNLGGAAGAGVAAHLHLHALPRWYGDVSFMTATAETRILPEALTVTWQRVREALARDGDAHGAGDFPAKPKTFPAKPKT